MNSSRSERLVSIISGRLGGLGDHRELARRPSSLVELVFVFQPRIEPSSRAGPTARRASPPPQPGRRAVLHQERIADMREDSAPAARGAAILRQLLSDRLDHAKHRRHVFLVMRQDDAGGERIRDQQSVLGGQCFDHDRARRRDLIVALRRDFDLHGLFFARLDRPDDAAIQAADDLVLLERRHPDHDGDAVAE